MYIVAVHDISDPEKFWGAVQAAPIPESIKLHHSFPNENGSRAVCLWEGESLGAIRSLVEDTVGGFSKNEFFEVESANALGLPG